MTKLAQKSCWIPHRQIILW